MGLGSISKYHRQVDEEEPVKICEHMPVSTHLYSLQS